MPCNLHLTPPSVTGHVHIKSDVYSYGVFLTELLTGKLVTRDNIHQTLTDQFKRATVTELPSFLDPSNEGERVVKDAVTMACIARLAMIRDWNRRPNMEEIMIRVRKVVEGIEERARRENEREAEARVREGRAGGEGSSG